MEALEMLKSRRSIRKFKEEQIKDDDLKKIIEAGMFAPTAMGLQSPLIVAVQNKEDVMTLNKLSLEIMNRNGGPRREGLPYYGAPTIIVVLGTKLAKSELFMNLDGAAATTNMLNAAHALGLGSVWIHRSKEIFESDEGKKLLKKWGIEEEVMGVASIALGYKDMPDPQPCPRRECYYKIVK